MIEKEKTPRLIVKINAGESINHFNMDPIRVPINIPLIPILYETTKKYDASMVEMTFIILIIKNIIVRS